MPTPLTWDAPGLHYDAGLTWDGMVPTPIPTQPNPILMNPTKAIIDFTDYLAAELGPIAQIVHTDMTTNAATFTAPTVSLVTFLAQIDAYNAAYLARASNATADVLAFNTAREVLEESLHRLGTYVNSVADGDVTIVEKSGFPSYEVDNAASSGPPQAPEDLRLKHGTLSGTVTARYKPDRRPSTNEVQINTVNPDSAADWRQFGLFQGGTAEITGLTPGALVWVRVRTVGLRGVMGAWSDPAQIRVL